MEGGPVQDAVLFGDVPPPFLRRQAVQLDRLERARLLDRASPLRARSAGRRSPVGSSFRALCLRMPVSSNPFPRAELFNEFAAIVQFHSPVLGSKRLADTAISYHVAFCNTASNGDFHANQLSAFGARLDNRGGVRGFCSSWPAWSTRRPRCPWPARHQRKLWQQWHQRRQRRPWPTRATGLTLL